MNKEQIDMEAEREGLALKTQNTRFREKTRSIRRTSTLPKSDKEIGRIWDYLVGHALEKELS